MKPVTSSPRESQIDDLTRCQVPRALEDVVRRLCCQYEQALAQGEESTYLAMVEQALSLFGQIVSQSVSEPSVAPSPLHPVISSQRATEKLKSSQRLTPSQQRALIALSQFLQGRDRYFRLTGYAGTGKSFLICEFMRHLKKMGLRFVAASPTNKASKNLQKLASQAGLKVECTTIAKLLGKQPQLNQESGKEEFIATYEVDLSVHDVIILDEFSMISQENFKEILESAQDSKIIFVGDGAQLPPVGEKEPIVAKSELIKQEATLTEVVRYDGEIGKIAEVIRSNPTYSSKIYSFVTTQDESVVCLQGNEWLNQAGELFSSVQFLQDADFCRFLVWRNKTAEQLNAWVRARLWGKDAPPYVIGDLLIAKKPVFRLCQSITNKRKKEWKIILNNSEECKVVAEPILRVNVNWQYWEVPVESEDGVQLKLKILTPESEVERQNKLQAFKEAKVWDQYINLDKSYDYCPYAYALTTHKAQGSSIDYIFLDVRDMKYSTDRQKLQYTALTRARKRAYIPV